MALINIAQSKTTTPLSSPILPGGKFNIDSMYQTQYINDLWEQYPNHDSVKNVITEGQQVYIAEGSKWVHDWSSEIAPPTYPLGTKYTRYEELKKDVVYTTEHKGEVWVLIDITNIANPIYSLDIQTLTSVKTDKILGWRLFGENTLKEGSQENPHLIWNSEEGWTSGKIKIEDIVPEENKIKDTVLSFDGTKVIWKSLDTVADLPTENRVVGNVLTVGINGNIIWSSVNSVKIDTQEIIDEDVTIIESYTISNDTTSANIYSKEAINHILSWKNL